MVDFAAWLSLVGSHWVSLMSGMVSLALGVWQRMRARAGEIENVPFVWIGVVFLFYASYQTWHDERQSFSQEHAIRMAAEESLQKERREIEKQTESSNAFNQFSNPRFRVALREATFLRPSAETTNGYVILIVELTNSGSPSVAHLVSCTLQDSSGKFIPATFTQLSGVNIFDAKGWRYGLYGSDSFIEKASIPIERGAQMTGYIALAVNDITKVKDISTVSVVVSDVNGKRYVEELPFWRSVLPNGMIYTYPGTQLNRPIPQATEQAPSR